MKKPVFVPQYNDPASDIPAEILIVADCLVPPSFAKGISRTLKSNVDLLYLDTSRKTRTGTLRRHLSYIQLAFKALRCRTNYQILIFWQQFIYIYFGLYPRRRQDVEVATFLFPLIYKKRKGIPGRVYFRLVRKALASSALTGAVCHSKSELADYKRFFPMSADRIHFLPLGIDPAPSSHGTAAEVHAPYIFSGGTSNRDYKTLLAAARNTDFHFIIACTPRDVAGLEIPSNVRIFHDAYDEKFNALLESASAVVLCFEDSNISSGQLVILRAMEFGKTIIATEAAGITDYIDPGCAYLVPPRNARELVCALNHIIQHRDEADSKGRAAKDRFKNRFSLVHFAEALGELIIPTKGKPCRRN